MGLRSWLRAGLLGLLDRRVDRLVRAEEEEGVREVEVEPFVGDDQGVGLLAAPLDLLLRAAPRVRALVVAPGSK